MIHTIISLDTWGPQDDNAVLSVAGVKADISKEDGSIDAFYSVVSLHSCFAYDLTVDPDTITRWLKPDRPKIVEQALLGDSYDLPVAIDGLFTWFNGDTTPVWCVSSMGGDASVQFHNVCKQLGQAIPWERSFEREYDTLAALVPCLPTPDSHDSNETSLDYAHHIARNLWFLYQYLES